MELDDWWLREEQVLSCGSRHVQMLETNIEPDGFTFAYTLTACSRLGALSHGKWVHGMMIEEKNRIKLYTFFCTGRNVLEVWKN